MIRRPRRGRAARPWVVTGAGVAGAGGLWRWLAREAERVAEARREAEEAAATFRAVFTSALDAMVIVDDEERFVDANPAAEAMLGERREQLVGRRPADFTSEALAALRGAFRERRTLRGEYEFSLRSGEPRIVEFSASADIQPGRHLAVMRDCTERILSRRALERRAAQEASLVDVGRLALGGLEPERLMHVIVGQVGDSLAADLVAIFECRAGGRELTLRAGRGWSRGVVGHAVVANDPATQLGRTLATGEATLVDDVRGDTRVRALPLLLEHGAASGATVPIRGRDRPWGVLAAYRRAPGRLTAEDANVLRVFANTLAATIERAADERELRRRSAEITRLAAERQRIVAEALAAEDRTRERISQQLHDELLQSLFVVRQDLAQAVRFGEAGQFLERAHDGVRQAIELLRAAVFDLHPVVLREGGLRAAVEAVAGHHARLGGFEVAVTLAPGAETEHDRLVLSLVRELLANIGRHAGARSVAVTLTPREGELVLAVSDDGRGMDTADIAGAAARGHIGLASAAQRVEALGGRFEVESRPGDGMTVRATIPLRAP